MPLFCRYSIFVHYLPIFDVLLHAARAYNVGCLIVINYPPIFFGGGVNLPIIIFGNL